MDTIYFGYWGSTLLAASSKKERIRLYLENVRGLKPKEYIIQPKSVSGTSWRAAYEDVHLVRYNDIFLCQRDLDILEKDIRDNEATIEGTFLGMRFIEPLFDVVDAISTGPNKKAGGQISTMLQSTLKAMSRFMANDENYRALERAVVLTSVVFSPNLDLYLKRVHQEEELRIMKEDYLDRVSDERS